MATFPTTPITIAIGNKINSITSHNNHQPHKWSTTNSIKPKNPLNKSTSNQTITHIHIKIIKITILTSVNNKVKNTIIENTTNNLKN